MKTNLRFLRFGLPILGIASALTINNQAQADSWERLPDGPGGRAYHSTAFTGDEIIVWGGGIDGRFLADGGALDVSTKTWRPVSTVQAPSGRWFHTAVWDGKEMILWGGRGSFSFYAHRPDGGRYDPESNTWRSMSRSNAPTPRSQFASVWTGTEMIVWGGLADNGTLNDGARYNPATDTWRRIAPSPLAARFEPTAVWTGTEMIVFGGVLITDKWRSYGDGARYNPATDTWTLLNPQGAPSSRTVHSAVWTGKEMLIWGGRFLNHPPELGYPVAGASYDPATDSWTPIPTLGSPEGRAGHAAVWNGQDMIIFGGWTGPNNVPYLNTGGVYNPSTKTWRPTTLVGAPSPRYYNVPNAAVWTGDAMFIYGGYDYPISLNSAYLYHTPVAPPRSPIEDLLADLESMELPRGVERPLVASLEAAWRSLENGQEHAAVNQLQAFQHKVEKQLRGDAAAHLIAAAQAIIDSLSN